MGPSLGLFYANHAIRGWTTLLVRGALLGLSVGMWFAATYRYSSEPDDADTDDGYDYPRWHHIAEPFLWGLAIFGPITAALVLGVVDLVAAPRAARRANAEYPKSSRSWMIVPMVVGGERGCAGPGLAVVGRF